MKLKKITQNLIVVGLLAAPFSLAQAQFEFVNTDFAVLEGDDVGWAVGSNSFVGGVWQAYITDGYTLDDRVDPSGSGFVFSSWDDGQSDRLENFLLQEYNAGPVASNWPTIFSTGDVIRFTGSASATRAGNDPSDMIVRAYIKTLGYNELGWEFQTKETYSAFHDIGPNLEPFDLSVTYPDITVDDSLQVVQIGFEITNEYDGTAMDSGTIYFENLDAFIEGEGPALWKGYEVDEFGIVDTGALLGQLYIVGDPLLWSFSLNTWIYMPEDEFGASGSWFYIFRM